MGFKFYSTKKIDALNCHYNLIIGERSNGKTYALKEKMIKNFIENGKQTALLRRWDEDFRGKRGKSMFSDMDIEKLTNGQYNTVKYFSGCWYLATKEEDDVRSQAMETPFCFGFAIGTMEHDKSTSYPNVNLIVFDEFLTRNYCTDEFVLFMNCLSTIIRQRDDVKIYMLGNTVNRYSPYFDEFGLKHIREMKPGDIDVYNYGKSGLKLAIEFTGTSQQQKTKKKSDVYFAFDNPKLSMITGKGGIWELSVYPHAPGKIKSDKIVYRFFIIWDREILQCDVVLDGLKYYLYIHKKTSPIKDPDHDLIYSVDFDPRPNWRRNILKPIDNVDKKISDFFRSSQVFYQNNEIGDAVRNYLEYCRTNMTG